MKKLSFNSVKLLGIFLLIFQFFIFFVTGGNLAIFLGSLLGTIIDPIIIIISIVIGLFLKNTKNSLIACGISAFLFALAISLMIGRRPELFFFIRLDVIFIWMYLTHLVVEGYKKNKK